MKVVTLVTMVTSKYTFSARALNQLRERINFGYSGDVAFVQFARY